MPPLRSVVSVILPACVAFALSVLLTAAVRALARRFGFVAKPKADRWHTRPTAMMGGVAIAVATLATFGLFDAALPPGRQTLAVIAGSSWLFAVGLIDDVLHIKPYQKLLGQVAGAAIVVSAGLLLPWTANPVVNAGLTIFWLVGITNAVNLLDNMDGLAAGVSATAALFFALSFAMNGSAQGAVMLSVFAAALIGFLLFNSNPASIFMGDCGSMFIGFFLASSALLGAVGARGRSFAVVVFVPVLVLLIPIFDTTLVTVLRKMAGRAASQGGRDHTSHRLVALGLSERRAVLLLYAFGGSAGILAMLVRDLPVVSAVASIGTFSIVLALLGVYLARVKVYDEPAARGAKGSPVVSFLIDLSYKRRVFEVLLDVCLVTLAYYWAHSLLGIVPQTPADLEAFIHALGLLVLLTMPLFLVSGMYRGLWRYVSIDDIITYGKAVALSAGPTLAVTMLLTSQSAVARIVILDALLLFVMLTASRVAFRALRRILPGPMLAVKRQVLIYGAGDAGDLLVRELLNNKELGRQPVAFVDDDLYKIGKRIHGLPVLGGRADIGRICRAHEIDELLVSTSQLSIETVEDLKHLCADAKVKASQMRLHFGSLTLDHEPEAATAADIRTEK